MKTHKNILRLKQSKNQNEEVIHFFPYTTQTGENSVTL